VAITEGAFTGTGTPPSVTCPQTVLSPGASTTCTAAYTTTQADVDAGSLTNTATATAASGVIRVESEPSTVTIPVQTHAAVSITKSASPDSPSDFVAGKTFTYSFVVTNTGNVTLTDIAIAEGHFTGTGALPPPVCPSTPLRPGDQLTCSTDYTITQADIDAGTVSNDATARATPTGSDTPITSPPSTAVIPEPQNPAATLVKTADTPSITHAGQKITYTFTITNTGNTDLTDPTITETTFTGHGTLTTPRCPASPASLLPGAHIACTATYTVVAGDLTGEPLRNTAIATLATPGGMPVRTDPATVGIPSTAPVTTTGPAAVIPGLAATGSDTTGIAQAGLVVLGLGLALVAVRRARKGRSRKGAV
jgi:uncharacterized repeat protein (TIGR01451 family)